jgi:hypothetical protein
VLPPTESTWTAGGVLPGVGTESGYGTTRRGNGGVETMIGGTGVIIGGISRGMIRRGRIGLPGILLGILLRLQRGRTGMVGMDERGKIGAVTKMNGARVSLSSRHAMA